MAAAGEFTAEGLREVASDEYGTYVLHRHAGDHEEGSECWCYPLTIKYIEVVSMKRLELQALLDSFYRLQ